jgi:hypothetical protein
MPKRRDAPKAMRNRGVSIAGQETVVARLTQERDEFLSNQTFILEGAKEPESCLPPAQIDVRFGSIATGSGRQQFRPCPLRPESGSQLAAVFAFAG